MPVGLVQALACRRVSASPVLSAMLCLHIAICRYKLIQRAEQAAWQAEGMSNPCCFGGWR